MARVYHEKLLSADWKTLNLGLNTRDLALSFFLLMFFISARFLRVVPPLALVLNVLLVSLLLLTNPLRYLYLRGLLVRIAYHSTFIHINGCYHAVSIFNRCNFKGGG